MIVYETCSNKFTNEESSSGTLGFGTCSIYMYLLVFLCPVHSVTTECALTASLDTRLQPGTFANFWKIKMEPLLTIT